MNRARYESHFPGRKWEDAPRLTGRNTMRANRERAESQVKNWNAANPVGTAVVVTLNNGDTKDTVTASAAVVAASGMPVIWLQGISGCYALDRVQVKR